MAHIFFHVFIFKISLWFNLSISVDKQHMVDFLFPLLTTSLLPSLLLNELIVSFFINELNLRFLWFFAIFGLIFYHVILWFLLPLFLSCLPYSIDVVFLFCPLFVFLVVWKYPIYHCFNTVSLLWYTLHTLQFTHLKCIIQ